MEHIDELVKRYPEFKELIQDTRVKIRGVDKIISQISQGGSSGPTLQPGGSSMNWRSNLKQRQVHIMEGQKASIIKSAGEIISERIAERPIAEHAKIEEDIQSIITSDTILEIDVKDTDTSQKYMLDGLEQYRRNSRYRTEDLERTSTRATEIEKEDNILDMDIDD